MIIMDWVRKITDIIMPLEPMPEEEEVVEKKEDAKAKPMQMPTQAQNLVENVAAKRAAAGGISAAYVNTSRGNTASVNGVNYTAYTDNSKTNRPNLQIIKAPEFVMKVYTPADYSQINGIADDILNHKAVVVNYEGRTTQNLRLYRRRLLRGGRRSYQNFRENFSVRTGGN